MNKIEEIKECIRERGFSGYEEVLLSSLEREEQAHTMSVFDLNMKIAEVGIALEKEKESTEKLRQRLDLEKLSYNGMELLLIKEKERADKAETELRKWNTPHEDSELQEMEEQSEQPSLAAKQAYINALRWHLKKAEERVKEKESIERLNKDTIMMLFDSVEKLKSNLQKLVEAVKKHHIRWQEVWDDPENHPTPFDIDEELYKVLEEVR